MLNLVWDDDPEYGSGGDMKIIVISCCFALLQQAAPAFAQKRMTPASYAHAQELEKNARLKIENLKEQNTRIISRRAQDENVKNILERAHGTLEEAYSNDRTAKVSKGLDYAATAAVIVITAGTAAAGQGTAALLKLIAAKVAVEAGKEAVGVPGASDPERWYANYANRREMERMATEMSAENSSLLDEAQRVLEDKNTTFPDKLRRIRDIEGRLQPALDKSMGDLIYNSKLITNQENDIAYFQAQGEMRRLAEEELIKKQAAKNKNPRDTLGDGVDKGAQTTVPTPQASPQDNAEERRRKMQKAITDYIRTIADTRKSECDKLEVSALKAMEPAGGRAFNPAAVIEERLDTKRNIEAALAAAISYRDNQSVFLQAQQRLEFTKKERESLTTMRTSMLSLKSDYDKQFTLLSRWQGVVNTYKPQGYYVGEPPDPRYQNCINYYASGLHYADSVLEATSGMESSLSGLKSQAESAMRKITGEAAAAAKELEAAYRDYVEYRDRLLKQMEASFEKIRPKADAVNGFPYRMELAARYDGDGDLPRLRTELGQVSSYAESLAENYWSAATLANDATDKANRLARMEEAPLIKEFYSIFYGGEAEDKKTCESAKLTPLSDRSRDSNAGNDFYQSITRLRVYKDMGRNIVIGGEFALEFITERDTKILSALQDASAKLKERAGRDYTYISTLDDKAYTEEIEKIGAPYHEALAVYDTLQNEIRRTPFFTQSAIAGPINEESIRAQGPGGWPMLYQTGFQTKQQKAALQELEEAQNKLWGDLRKYQDMRLSQQSENASQKLRAADTAAITAFYADFAKAYNNRNESAVLSFIADDWNSGDGTTLADLSDTLRRTFKMFDSVEVRITNLRISGSPLGAGLEAMYDLEIIGKNYRRNLTHEEKSAVSEYVERTGGRWKIMRTHSGRFWYVK